MKYLLLTFSLLASSLAMADNADLLKSISDVKRLAFATCNKQYMPQPIWPELIKERPDLFIFGGDNVYVNNDDPDKIKAAYELQNLNSDFKIFRNITPIIGTWDDHDYTNDNANGQYMFKDVSQKYFLDFFQEPKDSPRRKQKGIYTSYNLISSGRQIKIILLDTRYFKDVEKNAKLLGADQWKWLEEELADSRAKLTFIVTGFPVLALDMPMSVEWADYDVEKKRLLDLLGKKASHPVMFLTGDKHFGSIYRGANDYVELMSSGMTHTAKQALRPYIRRKFENYVFDLHYAMVEINWAKDIPQLNLAIKNEKGLPLVTQKLKWEGLRWTELKE